MALGDNFFPNIEKKTGKTIKDFVELAKEHGLGDHTIKPGKRIAWLKKEYALGHGHAMAMAHAIKNALTDGAHTVADGVGSATTAVKKATKRAVKNARKRLAKKATKKSVKKVAKKAVKKVAKKATAPVAKTAVKKAVKTAVKRAVKKTTKPVAKKATKRVAKKAAKRAA